MHSHVGGVRRTKATAPGWLVRLVFVLGWLCCSWPAHGDAPLRLEGNSGHVTATLYLEYRFSDPMAAVEAADRDSGWRPLNERRGLGSFAGVSQTIWFRLTVFTDASAGGEWIVGLPSPHVSSVQITLDTPGERRQSAAGGLQSLARAGGFPSRYPAFPLQLAPGKPHTILLEVRSESLLEMRIDLWRPAQWRAQELVDYAVLGMYFGLMAGLLVYNGFLALRLKDGAYTTYIAFGVALATYQLANTGIGPHLLWPSNGLLTIPLLSISTSVFSALGLVFTHRFLRLSGRNPRLAWTLKLSAASWIPVVASHFWLTPLEVSNALIVPLGLWTVAIILYTGLVSARDRIPGATYFLIGWSALAVAGLFRILVQLGLLPNHPLLDNGLLLASGFEMLMLSLALADRIMEERRARAQAEAERLQESVARRSVQAALQEKSNFMAAVAHDLQQPVYAIGLALESVRRQRSGVSNEDATRHMQSALQVADELLSSMATAVRLERSTLTPEVQVFSLQDMLERIDSMFSPIALERGLGWRVTPSLHQVESDPALLERMICNLASNAIRYTGKGGVMISCRQRSKHVLVQVWDTGPGIPAGDHELIFQMHQRGREASAQPQGLGLGLAIVKGCADLLQIRMELRSVPGRGSCFGMWVPVPSTGNAGDGTVTLPAMNRPAPPSWPVVAAPARDRPASRAT